MATQFTSPVGRMVQGDFFEPQTKDAQGNLRTVKTGPNMGQPSPQYYVALAFAKNDPRWPAFHQMITTEAAKSFPTLFPQGANGPCVNPNFSFKVIDGDGIDQTGKPNATKEGFAGHWVVRFTTGYAPQVFPAGKYSVMDRIADKNMTRRGYYYRIAGTMSGNDNMQRPGVYLNMQLAELVGYGPEIVSGPDASEAFGKPAALPAGANPTPAATATPMVAAAPAATPPQASHAGFQGAPPMPTASPSSPPPYNGYMTPPVPVAPPAKVMTAKANGVSYESFVAAGWSDDTMRANGYLI